MSQYESHRISRRAALAVSAGAAAAAAFSGTAALAQTVQAKTVKAKKGTLKGKRVLVGIGEFSEGMETYYMVYRLKEEGVVPVVAAAAVKRLQMVVHDFDPAYSNYTEKLGYVIKTDIAYKDVKPGEYDALLIPGGRGPEEMRQDADVLRITRYFLEKDLPLGAMCHGPQVLYAAGSVKGRRIAAFSGIRADIELAGATFVDEPVVVDGRLVTSRGWPDLPEFMPKFLEVLAG
jgi:protease I